MVAMSAAFGGLALASSHVTVDQPAQVSAAPGGQVDVTIDLTSDQSDIEVFDIVAPDDELTIVDGESDQAQFLLDEDGDAASVLYLASVDSDTITLTVEVAAGANPGSYGLEGTAVDANGNEYTESTDVNVGDSGPFTVDDLEVVDAEVGTDEPFTVAANVTNEGGASGETALRAFLDGQEVANSTQVIDAGATEQVTFELTAPSTAGTYDWYLETDDDTPAAASVEVVETQAGPFTVSNLQTNQDPVPTGDTFTVSAEVTNEGADDGQTSVRAFLDGQEVASSTQQVDAGNTETVTFDLTAPATAGTYDWYIETDDDTPSASTVEVVDAVPGPFTVDAVQPQGASVAPLEAITVTATISNDGDAAGDADISLLLNGVQVDSATENIGADSSGTVTLTLTAPDATGDHAYSVQTQSQGEIMTETFTVDFVLTYANDQGVIDSQGIIQAVQDWRNDEITINQLIDVVQAWRSG